MYFRPIRTKKPACGFINWCCLNRKKRLNKKEPIMVYSFRENVPLFVSLISLVPSSNEDKTGTSETNNNHTTSD